MLITTSGGGFQLPRAPGQLIGVFQIHPGGIIPRAERRCAKRYDFDYRIIEADPLDESASGTRPADFHAVTLEWALSTATLIVPWAGLIPFDRDFFSGRIEAHARKGGRIALLLIRSEHFDEWTEFAAMRAKPDAEFVVVKPLPAGLPAVTKRQNIQSSEAVH